MPSVERTRDAAWQRWFRGDQLWCYSCKDWELKGCGEKGHDLGDGGKEGE